MLILLNSLSKNSCLYGISHKEFIEPFLAKWNPVVSSLGHFGKAYKINESVVKLPSASKKNTRLTCIKLRLMTMR